MNLHEPSTRDQPMSHSVRTHLRLAIDAYDESIRKFIPGYEEGLTRAADEIAAIRPGLVLDLGAGTGALAEAVLEHERVGCVEAIDIDPGDAGQGAYSAQAIRNPRAFEPAFLRCSAPRM